MQLRRRQLLNSSSRPIYNKRECIVAVHSWRRKKMSEAFRKACRLVYYPLNVLSITLISLKYSKFLPGCHQLPVSNQLLWMYYSSMPEALIKPIIENVFIYFFFFLFSLYISLFLFLSICLSLFHTPLPSPLNTILKTYKEPLLFTYFLFQHDCHLF